MKIENNVVRRTDWAQLTDLASQYLSADILIRVVLVSSWNWLHHYLVNNTPLLLKLTLFCVTWSLSMKYNNDKSRFTQCANHIRKCHISQPARLQNNALSNSYTQFDFLNSFSLKLVSQNKEKLSGVTFFKSYCFKLVLKGYRLKARPDWNTYYIILILLPKLLSFVK